MVAPQDSPAKAERTPDKARDEVLARVGARLKEARHESGMSQEQVSKTLGRGFSLASMYRWESGIDLPTFDKMARLAELYRTSLDWLAGRTDCKDVFVHGKVVVDRDAMRTIDELAEAGKALADLPPGIEHGAGLSCAWPVPRRPMMLDREAAVTIEHHLRDAYQKLRSRS